MNLLFDLKPDIIEHLHLSDTEKLRYCVPYDLGSDNTYVKQSYIAASERRIFIIEEGHLLYEIDIKQCQSMNCIAYTDCGILRLTVKDKSILPKGYTLDEGILANGEFILAKFSVLRELVLHEVKFKAFHDTAAQPHFEPGIDLQLSSGLRS